MKNQIKQVIASIEPFGTLETEHITDAIAWIDSGAEIFRIEKPATPLKHLVVYFALIDPERNKIMLVDHVTFGLWLPPGGHVEKDEHPKATVEREIKEELYISADFLSPHPFFLTQTITVGTTAGHVDVDLWYILRADSNAHFIHNLQEFKEYKWLSPQEILETNIAKLDPHMYRFIQKILTRKIVQY